MKVLVTTPAGLGHVLPVLPLAVELQARGHDLHWVVGPGDEATVAATGIEHTIAGMPVPNRRSELIRRHPELPTLPMTEARSVAFSTLFGELAAPEVMETLRSVVAEWQPDVVVHDAAELAGPLAAKSAGIRSVCHGFGELVPEPTMRRTGTVLAPSWAAAGLTPDPYAGSYRGLYVDIYPPSLRSEDMAHVTRVQLRRPADGTPASGSLVYVTFGTVFNVVDDGFRAAVLGAASVADEVLVTVGSTGDPDRVGPVPANVRVERFVPQAEVLPRCAAVVCHGGSGTVLASLAHGVPLVCLPRAADQFTNAFNVARVGAGSVLMGDDVTEATVRTTVAQILETDGPRTAAQALAEEIAAMPPDAEVAAVIEALVADR